MQNKVRSFAVDDTERFSSADFIFDDFAPADKIKRSIFLKTKGLTMPRHFSFKKEAGSNAAAVSAEGFKKEQDLIRQVNAAA